MEIEATVEALLDDAIVYVYIRFLKIFEILGKPGKF